MPAQRLQCQQVGHGEWDRTARNLLLFFFSKERSRRLWPSLIDDDDDPNICRSIARPTRAHVASSNSFFLSSVARPSFLTSVSIAVCPLQKTIQQVALFRNKALSSPPPSSLRRLSSSPPPRKMSTNAAVSAGTVSRLDSVPQAPPDPILGVSEAFRADTSPERLNLGVGAYRTEELKPWVLPVVVEAERRMLAAGSDKEYLPIEGFAPFNAATARLLLGDDSAALKEKRVATIQCLSGTGSLRIGADFIAKFLPKGTKVFVSDPTWGNHFNIFGDAGLECGKYRYFDAKTVGLDFEGMIADLDSVPKGSVIVLHGEILFFPCRPLFKKNNKDNKDNKNKSSE